MGFLTTSRARLLERPASKVPPRQWPPARLSLALQGGGSFGAFTWGVLDRLLEDESIGIDGMSGSSAGAVNAVVLASGLLEGGREGARANLAKFWQNMSKAASFVPLSSLPMNTFFTPAQLNPFDLNPLREALASHVDFEKLQSEKAPRLLIATTRVSDGALRIFRNGEMKADVVLASACLPMLHNGVDIDGELYWDGGYAANPPLIPLVHETNADAVLAVQITPAKAVRAPKTRSEIARRLDQIMFNSTLNAEIEALKLAIKLGATEKLKKLRIDRISADDEIAGLADENAGNLLGYFVKGLFASGRHAAEAYIAEDVQLARAP